jgi:hypothetical protein
MIVSPLGRLTDTEPSVCRTASTAAQRGVILRLEKKDSLPMSTKSPTAPATGAALVSLNASVSVPLTVAVRRVSSMSSLSVIHSSGPMSAPAS